MIIFIPPFSISKLSTFLFIFSNALLLLYFLFHKNLYNIVLMRVSTLCVKASNRPLPRLCLAMAPPGTLLHLDYACLMPNPYAPTKGVTQF